MLSSIFSHGLKAFVGGLQRSLLLLAVIGGRALARGQGVQPQLGQGADEDMQLATRPILQSHAQRQHHCFQVSYPGYLFPMKSNTACCCPSAGWPLGNVLTALHVMPCIVRSCMRPPCTKSLAAKHPGAYMLHMRLLQSGAKRTAAAIY